MGKRLGLRVSGRFREVAAYWRWSLFEDRLYFLFGLMVPLSGLPKSKPSFFHFHLRFKIIYPGYKFNLNTVLQLTLQKLLTKLKSYILQNLK